MRKLPMKMDGDEKEIWKEIDGFPIYMVSNMGRVKSIERPGIHRRWKTPLVVKEKILILSKHGECGRYRQVALIRKSNHLKKFLVHRLVAIAFIENKNSEPYVDHINRNPSDNRAVNLRWVSQEHNLRNGKSHKDSSSKYLGVCYSKSMGRWRANINIHDKQEYIGTYETEKEANNARCEYEYLLKDYLNISTTRTRELEKMLGI